MKTQFAESEFKNMDFNPFEAKKTMLEKYPELAKYKEFSDSVPEIDKDKVIRYIAFCFQKTSPIVKKENDLNKRKFASLELAGFKAGKNGYPDIVMRMVNGEVKKVNRMIIRFLKSTQRDIKFATVIAASENYYHNLNLLQSNEKTDDVLGEAEKKAKIAKLLPDLLENIENLSKDIFVGDTVLLYTAQEMEEEETEEEIPYAEKFARQAENQN